MQYPSKASNAQLSDCPLRTNGCIASSPRERSETAPCMITSWKLFAYESLDPQSREREGSLVPMLPTSFLSLFLLDSPTRQASKTAQSPTSCLSQGPRACPCPEPLTSHPSSASTSVDQRWVSPSTLIGQMLDLTISNCPPRYLRLLQQPETFINSPIP